MTAKIMVQDSLESYGMGMYRVLQIDLKTIYASMQASVARFAIVGFLDLVVAENVSSKRPRL